MERAIAAQDKDGLDTSKNDEETAACSLSQQQVWVQHAESYHTKQTIRKCTKQELCSTAKFAHCFNL